MVSGGRLMRFAISSDDRALAADDALKRQDLETRFRVRETPEWRKHAAALEAEMIRRGLLFDVIDWSEHQATLPFEFRDS
jgi:hypothetical protein